MSTERVDEADRPPETAVPAASVAPRSPSLTRTLGARGPMRAGIILRRTTLILLTGIAGGIVLTLCISAVVAGPRFVWGEISDLGSEASWRLGRYRWFEIPGLRITESRWNELAESLISTHLETYPPDAGDSDAVLITSPHFRGHAQSLGSPRYRTTTYAEIRAIVDTLGACDYVDLFVCDFTVDSIYIQVAERTEIAPSIVGEQTYHSIVIPSTYLYRCSRAGDGWVCNETDT